jgi:hypothetical protein
MTVCSALLCDAITVPWRPFVRPRSSGILYQQIPGNLPYVTMYSRVIRPYLLIHIHAELVRCIFEMSYHGISCVKIDECVFLFIL